MSIGLTGRKPAEPTEDAAKSVAEVPADDTAELSQEAVEPAVRANRIEEIAPSLSKPPNARELVTQGGSHPTTAH